MDEPTFDALAHDELAYLEERLEAVDPDAVDVSTSDGVLRLELRNGVKIVINSHRAARQIWMAAVSTAWHFDPPVDGGRWVATRTNDELRTTVSRLLHEYVGVVISL